MRKYRPRRAGKRWLEGAPDYVLDCFDLPQFADRYTVIFGGDFIEGDGTFGGTWLHYLATGAYCGGSGDFQAYQAADYRYRNKHRRIRWTDIPENIRNKVTAWAEQD